ncbi:MAG: hypothetical protein ABIG69_06945 [Bacteroidota bacterium]
MIKIKTRGGNGLATVNAANITFFESEPLKGDDKDFKFRITIQFVSGREFSKYLKDETELNELCAKIENDIDRINLSK